MLDRLTSQEIEGRFWERFEETGTSAWADSLTIDNLDSNKEEEIYRFTGMAPRLKLWKGERTAEKIRVFETRVRNQEYEASFEPLIKDLRRDMTGQIFRRIDEIADGAGEHKAELISNLILNGHTDEGYDGVPFFATTHSEGDSGTQSNLISETVVSTSAITEKEMAKGILNAIKQIWKLKDDKGNPRNQGARSFMVTVPIDLWDVALSAITVPMLPGDAGAQNFVALQERFMITVEPNPYITWADDMAVTRQDGALAPFIYQEEVPIQLEVIGDGSELEVYQKKHFYGAYTVRGADYGWWTYACKVNFTT